MLVRMSCPAVSMIPATVLVVAFMVGCLLGPAGPARAADDPARPWVVTRKADNRVLPKQDSVEDIEKGLAEPGKPASKEAAKTAPKAATASAAKGTAAQPPAKKTASPAAKPAPQPASKPAPQPAAKLVSGLASEPTFTVSETQIVIMLPISAGVTDTRYLNLDDPRRLALDVMGAWKYEGEKKFAVNKGVLEKVELGTHDDFLRLVLHLTKGPMPGEIVPNFQLVEGGLRMTVPLTK